MVKNVCWKHFSNLGISRWLDDELINHFVQKWCYQSTVLGLSSFFPVKFLFETENCDIAVDLSQIVSDAQYQRSVLKWIKKGQVRSRVFSNWTTGSYSSFSRVCRKLNGSIKYLFQSMGGGVTGIQLASTTCRRG